MRACIVLLFSAAWCFAAAPYQPTAAETAQIRARLQELEARIQKLSAPDDLAADVAVYAKAAQWILRYPEEFFTQAYVANTLAALDRGIERAKALERGASPWAQQKGRLVRAYRSRVDGSLQPYGMIVPESYDGSKPVRLDVVLHGRGSTLNEVSFLAAHDSTVPIPAGVDYLQVEVFGRTNNAYRWSGETDVFEALESVQKRYRVDPKRIVLRGFSMGGAGTWHIGLHYPDRWAGMEAGAGFVETRKYAKQPDLPPYQDLPLSIYDALDYSLNAVNLAVVGYGGEIDPQLAASASIRQALMEAGYPFTPDGLNWRTTAMRALFLVGPQTPHRFHPESKKISEAFLADAAARGVQDPEKIRFVT
ncbi:MAG TPA: prolyl oligopeptidase family serine peptidase, partial [Bryobacteraceae bacterium]|nr:prolyl oligopeptidase family serine peptidase [Bryobacteraceae bacterium]